MAAAATGVGALVLFCADIEETARFYRALGIRLEAERHNDGPAHYACELGSCHFALYEGSKAAAPAFRSGGSIFPGFVVTSVDESLAAARAAGSRLLQELELYPWGRRCVIEDPDGRAVEIYEPSTESN